jgi:hypothetical protein
MALPMPTTSRSGPVIGSVPSAFPVLREYPGKKSLWHWKSVDPFLEIPFVSITYKCNSRFGEPGIYAAANREAKPETGK